MFRWLNKQGVESSDGSFVVQSVDRFTIEYREGSKKVSVHVERGASPTYEISRKDFARWDKSEFVFLGAPIPEEKQNEMIENFKKAMEFQGITVVVGE